MNGFGGKCFLKNKMEDTITINTEVFNHLMKLVYMFVPQSEIKRLEEMIDKRNEQMKEFLYKRSIH